MMVEASRLLQLARQILLTVSEPHEQCHRVAQSLRGQSVGRARASSATHCPRCRWTFGGLARCDGHTGYVRYLRAVHTRSRMAVGVQPTPTDRAPSAVHFSGMV